VKRRFYFITAEVPQKSFKKIAWVRRHARPKERRSFLSSRKAPTMINVSSGRFESSIAVCSWVRYLVFPMLTAALAHCQGMKDGSKR